MYGVDRRLRLQRCEDRAVRLMVQPASKAASVSVTPVSVKTSAGTPVLMNIDWTMAAPLVMSKLAPMCGINH